MPAPLAIVKAKFEKKDKLVDVLVGLLSKETEEPKDDLRKRLLGASNSKLLKLHDAASTVKDKFGGSRASLVEATATAQGKAKDKDYVGKLESFSSARLIDIQKAATRRAKNAASKGAPKPAGKTAAAKPAPKAAAKPAAKAAKPGAKAAKK